MSDFGAVQTFAGFALAVFIVTSFLVKSNNTRRSFHAIPTIGFSVFPLSLFSATSFFIQGKRFLDEGYQKYKSGIFKIRTVDGWLVVAAGQRYINDVRQAPEDLLSFSDAAARDHQVKWIFGPEILDDQYHVSIIRDQLTRNIASYFPDLRDEVVSAFKDIIPVDNGASWVRINTQKAVQKIICRVSNRIFVGLPVCRDEDYVALNIEFTIDVVIGAKILLLFPGFLKPFAARIFTRLAQQIARQMRHLGPVIEERERAIRERGDNWPEKPNDLLMWCMEEAVGQERTVRNLSRRMLSVNFAAVHTSAIGMTQSLYYLASLPHEVTQSMRDEVEGAIREHGWSKAAMATLFKVDSFLKEVQRMDNLGVVTMARIARREFVFSNGVHVPAGTMVSCVSRGVHHDAEFYADPDTFDPYRFVRMSERDNGEVNRHQLVATSTEFVNFGHGRHACPGRFFAAYELKALLAHVLMEYDIKFVDGQGLPRPSYVGVSCIPADVDLLFKKRSR